MMSRVLILLALMPFLFSADIFLNEGNLSTMNGTQTNIALGDCYVLSGNNFTFVRLCPVAVEAVNLQLQPDGVYQHPTLPIKVTAPAKINQTVTLKHGENITNSLYNFTYIAPAKKDINSNLSFGQNYYDAETNISLKCQEQDLNICKQNEVIQLEMSQNYNNPLCNISVKAPPKPNLAIDLTMGYGESYVRDDYGINIKSPAKCEVCLRDLDLKLNENNTKYQNPEKNITFTCEIPDQSKIWFENETCNTTLTYTVGDRQFPMCENLLPCTETEKLMGIPQGMFACLNRTINVTQTERDEAISARDLAKEEARILREAKQTKEKEQQDATDMWATVAIVIFALIGLVVFLSYMRNKEVSKSG